MKLLVWSMNSRHPSSRLLLLNSSNPFLTHHERVSGRRSESP
jgi:hypothetical protein